VLAGLAGTALALSIPEAVLAHGASVNPVFRHGVASGDPDATGVVLWTRVTAEGDVTVEWELSPDVEFASIARSGSFATGPDRDHTVKVLAAGLAPGETWFYRFRLNGVRSPVGRARTLPVGRLDRLGIALASCSNYAFGFFNAYGAIARDADVDFVLHTGDYIYEYGADEWGADVAHAIGRVHEPAHEIVSLADYRQRHAQYKTDAGSRAMLAAHTLLACWDDHESANNPWTGGAQNHQPKTEGDWNTRRAASIRAYFEWMPVREPEWLAEPGRTRMQFWRAYRFGDLAMLHTLETRHTGRAEQIDYRDHVDRIRTPADGAAFVRDVLGAPGRAMLAPELEADLDKALRKSVADGQPWRLIGCPMIMARTVTPDIVARGLVPDPFAASNADVTAGMASSDSIKSFAWRGKFGLPLYTDPWDGYGWARERFYERARAAGAADLVVLSGDSHSFWANSLSDDRGRACGIELGTAGISSPGDFVGSGFDHAMARAMDAAVADHNREVEWTDNMHQGYVRIELAREAGTATFVAVETVLRPDSATRAIKRFDFRPDKGSVAFEGTRTG